MSLSGALSNALSGLNASSRAAQVTASNLSNALTDGYGRREVSLSSTATYGGVTINGIDRMVNSGVIGERRIAASDQANAGRIADYHTSLENLVGTPNDSFSLSAQIDDFEGSLIDAASRPDLDQRLNQVVIDAKDLTSSIERISDGIQTLRGNADTEIGTMVNDLNTALEQVSDLNAKISSSLVMGRDTSGLQDQRQILIDQISQIVPVKEVPRDYGAVALFTTGGSILLDGSPATVDFTTTNTITPYMTQDNGQLSGLQVNGRDIRTDANNGPLSGGDLAALFTVRDDLAEESQTQLDAIARDLVERFQDSGLDTTLAPGDAGLFTDGGGPFAAIDEVGLSGRLSVNAAVDPDTGGETWRIRDGIGAVTAGAVGNSGLIQDLQTALTQTRTPASGAFTGGAYSASDLNANFLAQIGSNRNTSDQILTFATTQYSQLEALVFEDGVNSDQEMQNLLLIEQSYSANARMIQVIDEMMQILMGI